MSAISSSIQHQVHGLENTTLTLYQDVGQLSDRFEASVTKGTQLFKYDNLIKGIQENSPFFYIKEGEGYTVSQSFCKETFSYNNLFQSLKGEDVQVELKNGSCEGILFDVTGSHLIIRHEETGKIHMVKIDHVESLFSSALESKLNIAPCLKINWVSKSAQKGLL